MSIPSPGPAPGPEQLVTSSDLVRRFGLWQERATRMPLYILHRGRARFVLISVETMDALCAAQTPGGRATIDATALLDGIGELVLIAGGDARIVAASRAARAHFGGLAAVGARLDGVAPFATRPFLAAAMQRVIDSGVAERFDFASPVRAGRMLAAMLAPSGSGVALFAQDGTGAREHARTRAVAQAGAQAMAAVGAVAAVTLSPRGYVVDPDAALAALTGLTRDALATIRFVALSEIGGRVALGDAIERVLASGTVEAVDGTLLVNRSAALPVRIGLAPIRNGVAIDGASAIIAARARPT